MHQGQAAFPHTPHTIGMIGIKGRMGQGIKHTCSQMFPEARVIGYDKQQHHDSSTLSSLEALWQESSVVLDFSHASLFDAVMAAAQRHPKPFVLGTSGIPHEHAHDQLLALAQHVPVMWAPNTCLGAVLQRWIARHVAAVMPLPYDVDIVEIHHRHKEDAPSGTALALAQAISEASTPHHQVHGTSLTWGLATSPRQEGHIDMHAMRISHTPCQHQVMWTSAMEQLTISHTVFSREALVKGAVDLMMWLVAPQRSNGLYHVEDRWGLSPPAH